MARQKNPNTPEDGKVLSSTVDPEMAAQFRILAMVNGATVSDYLRDLVSAHLAENPVAITVNGKALTNTGA